MPIRSALFETRREAEMAVEHIVQEYGIDRTAVSIVAVSQANSAGTRVSGSDIENGDDKAPTASAPALAGQLKVSVDVESDAIDKVKASFATYGGKDAD